MYSEDDLLPLSGLQHLAYCPRQFALIHIEQVWAENRFTAEGQLMHRRVNEETHESRGDLHIAHAVRVRSLQYGLSGIADVVEFHRAAEGITLAGKAGRWLPFPVEYKRGKPKQGNMDEVQLCAQALCLEEMLGTGIPAGALFYGKTRRRKEIAFTDGLRTQTIQLAERMHALWSARQTPPAEFGPQCEQCSLMECCMPQHPSAIRTRRYLESIFTEDVP
ncbi:MAG: CRISPR-associated protein Cas4 [Gammaproteobacteria bacterium]|nr:CRISPR-associated protein Cas4 [Gammaproteobacteria bacterium]MBU1656452.1 CRISPR-associated protein Cas4 [Gammaproteobacteria bacterium]MBU1962249.1 CRISPR-associated protein Cas4 [Gammaproteobacteria bacterium]